MLLYPSPHIAIYFRWFLLSFHPNSSFIPRIVQSFAGISQQFVAVLHQWKEFAVGWCVSTTGRKGTPLVLWGIQTFAGIGEDFIAYLQMVDERSVWRAVAARHPWAVTICYLLHSGAPLTLVISMTSASYLLWWWHLYKLFTLILIHSKKIKTRCLLKKESI